jgi:hypothetical protein
MAITAICVYNNNVYHQLDYSISFSILKKISNYFFKCWKSTMFKSPTANQDIWVIENPSQKEKVCFRQIIKKFNF